MDAVAIAGSLKDDLVLAHTLYNDMLCVQSVDEFNRTFNTMSYLVPSIAEDVARITGRTVEDVATDVIDMIAYNEKAATFLRDHGIAV
ncbi:MAG: hypothetical protein IKH75_01010 [Ruminococcus sp.]|nr:hypothetical protein [Ruminococcus sp.]